MTACVIGVGLVALPASATKKPGLPAPAGDTVAASLIATTSLTDIPGFATTPSRSGTAVALAVAKVSGSHEWYYRIYVVGTGQTLFRWVFRSTYSYVPNQYWINFSRPVGEIQVLDPSIQASVVPGKLKAVPGQGINGPLEVRFDGATFKYCPNGTCVKTFTPLLGYLYRLDGSRTYTGNVPFDQG